jgi:hypothetical protein
MAMPPCCQASWPDVACRVTVSRTTRLPPGANVTWIRGVATAPPITTAYSHRGPPASSTHWTSTTPWGGARQQRGVHAVPRLCVRRHAVVGQKRLAPLALRQEHSPQRALGARLVLRDQHEPRPRGLRLRQQVPHRGGGWRAVLGVDRPPRREGEPSREPA